MNAAAFRSHLMQQFVSAARHQARTPIALIGWVPEGTEQERSGSWATATRQQQQPLSSIASTSSSSHAASPPSPGRAYPGGRGSMKKSVLSTLVPPATPTRDLDDNTEATDKHEPETRATATQESTPSNTIPQYNNTATVASFQTLLRTRRTTSNFRTSTPPLTDDATGLLLTPEQYRGALHRAVLAGRAAPNHKRTEPFSFRRLIAPSTSTERLADIAQQVYMRSKRNDEDPALVVAAAQRKRDKWSQIPAFLVTLVSTSTKPEESHNAHDPFPSTSRRSGSSTSNSSTTTTANEPHSRYDPLPYQPPATERALEDYAAACAATQNVLLSLHSEGLASKWATGPVIHTPAFRDLIQAGPDDRVVALVMIGQAPPVVEPRTTTSHHHRPRRFRRSLEGDVLRDL